MVINRRKAFIATDVLSGETLEAVGKRYEITRERARQILKEVVRSVDPKLLDDCKQNNMGRRKGQLTMTPYLRKHAQRLCLLIIHNDRYQIKQQEEK